MATVHVRYGITKLIHGEVESHFSLTGPVDDVLGLADLSPRFSNRRDRIHVRYSEVGLLRGVEPPLTLNPDKRLAQIKRLDARFRSWRRQGIPETFLQAAKQAQAGRFPVGLVGYLERIRFDQGQPTAEVHDLFELAAWSLERALHEQPFKIVKCELCRVRFLSSGRARYCRRGAPVSNRQTCQEVGKVLDYRARQREREKETLDLLRNAIRTAKGGKDDGSDS